MEPYSSRYCDELPTKPIKAGKILVTGATGYIGSELIPELIERGYQVRVMVRSYSPNFEVQWPKSVEIVVADALNYDELVKALEGIDTAYYLMHSLHLKNNKFIEVDNHMAANFRKAAQENNINRIIYLGGLGNQHSELSDHLRSRHKVSEELSKGKILVTTLNAAVIIGSGSSSYKIIKHLVLNCPLLLFPTRANSKCQPIAIKDVIKYLVGSLETPHTIGKSYDIGGTNILSYQDMLRIQSKVIGKRRIIIPTSLLSINICVRISSFLTPIRFELIKSLMKSCAYDSVCQSNEIRNLIPFKPLKYKKALRKALIRESQRELAIKALAMSQKEGEANSKARMLSPPSKSNGIFSDINNFLIKRPEIPTLVKFYSDSERENYTFRILQRLDVEVSNYRILNIHKIGVKAPAKYVFEELLKWNGDSTCWPNHLAMVTRRNEKLENLWMYFLGWEKYPSWVQKLLRVESKPLFKLDAINIQMAPDPMGSDNARYLLYKCSGGYPIGIFCMYVRSSIADQNEIEQCQLFLMVGFNFYGKESLSKIKYLNRIWEAIHNRATSNVLNRLKLLSEWRFGKIQNIGAI